MNPTPATRVLEILDELTSYIDSGMEMDRFTFNKLMRQIESLPDLHHRVMCKALAYGAIKDEEAALGWFAEGLTFQNPIITRNYLIYINRLGKNTLTRRESLRLCPGFNDDNLAWRALNAASGKGDIIQAEVLLEKLISLMPDEQREREAHIFVSEVSDMKRFQEITGLGPTKIEQLCMLMDQIADEFSASVVFSDYLLDENGPDSAYVMIVNNADSDVISDMNFDLALKLAETDLFDGKNGTAWFRAMPKIAPADAV